MRKKILAFGDMHSGSLYGLLPPDFVDVRGNPHEQAPGQKYLWDCWTEMLGSVPPASVDMVAVVGDTIDGKQPKSNGEPLTLHRLEDQVDAARVVLEGVRRRFPTAEWVFVEGTPYHETADVLRPLVREFSRWPLEQTQRFPVGEAWVQLHHEVGGGMCKSAPLEREIVRDLLAAGRHKWQDHHVLVRAHRHCWGGWFEGKRVAISLPCWQLQSEHAARRSPAAYVADIGAVILTVDDSLLRRGMCPASFKEHLFPHPQSRAISPWLSPA
jgi:hypothetical protein